MHCRLTLLHSYMDFNAKNAKKWMLFERFKMSLYDNDEDRKETDINDELEAANGKKYPSEKVFIAAFHHIKEQTQLWINQKQLGIKDKDIQWILTVPAIWSNKSNSQ